MFENHHVISPHIPCKGGNHKYEYDFIGFLNVGFRHQNNIDEYMKELTGLIRWVAPLIAIQTSDLRLFRKLFLGPKFCAPT